MSPTTRARTLAASLAAVLALGGLAACGSGSSSTSSATTTGSDNVVVTDAWARASAMSTGDGAAYFTVANDGSTEDELTGVSVPVSVAASAQMHETMLASGDTMGGDAIMTMKEVTSVPIPAGGDVHFEPGGHHVMLIELVKPLEAGQTISLTLTFAKAGKITVDAQVRAS